MSESFGARLRLHRQHRQIPLRTIAEQTKIKLSLLEGLEKDDISQWPAGIFRRAYVRSYANAVGLDPDVVTREFLELYPEVQPAQPVADSGSAGQTRFRSIVETAFGRFRRSTGSDDVVTTSQSDGNERRAQAAEPATRLVAPPPPPSQPVQQPDDTRRDPVEVPPGLSVATVGRSEPASPDWLAAARVCTDLGRVQRLSDVTPLLKDACGVLGAVGLIVWLWDAAAGELKPALAQGYPAKVLARMRGVAPDADNLTAAAFRSSDTLAVSGEGNGPGALALPLLAPLACVGVLAIELPRGAEQCAPVRAAATFFAAMLAQLFAGEAVSTAAEDASPPEPGAAREEPLPSSYQEDRMLPAANS